MYGTLAEMRLFFIAGTHRVQKPLDVKYCISGNNSEHDIIANLA